MPFRLMLTNILGLLIIIKFLPKCDDFVIGNSVKGKTLKD